MWDHSLRHDIEDLFSILTVPEYRGYHQCSGSRIDRETVLANKRSYTAKYHRDRLATDAEFRERRRAQWRESKRRKAAER